MMKSKYMSTNHLNKNRLPWLDIAKAIAMITVVFSHEFASVKPFVMLCNSFMLPLFFMCSGFCLSPKKYGKTEYLKRKSKTLLLPYLALGLIVSLLHFGVDGIDSVMVRIGKEVFSWQTLWFLPVLFLADVILYNFLSISRNVKLTNLVVGLVSLLLGFLFCWKNITMIIDMSVVAIAVFYLSVGYGMKRMFSAETIRYQGSLGFSLLVIGLGIMILTKSNLVLKLNDILPLWKVAFSTMEAMGIMLILSTIVPPLQKLHCVIHLLEYIGKNTMVIFAFHMPIFFYSQTFIRPFFKSQLYYKPIEFVLMWGICLVLTPLFNRYAPILIGKKHNR